MNYVDVHTYVFSKDVYVYHFWREINIKKLTVKKGKSQMASKRFFKYY